VSALEDLLQDATAGDPITGLKWTHKSTRDLSEALRRRGFRASPNTVARLLREHDYSLRTNRKRLAGTSDSDRDRQFRYLSRLRRLYFTRGLPVISVDTKKKEWVGNFKNPGRCWRRQARAVLDHDFPSWAVGRAIPYGIYDEARNDGSVVIGTSHETPSFAVAAIRRWWQEVGRRRYPQARRLLVQADGGGANDARKWEWKVALQRLADEFGLIIAVTHYPPGASKWNPIDHRMFSLISGNWSGEPLVSYEAMLKYIRSTRSAKGFHCRAHLDTKEYSTGLKMTAEQKASVRLRPRKVLPQWNYMIWPHKHPRKGSSYF
jgi:Rhodopirellula transposase DDE domain